MFRRLLVAAALIVAGAVPVSATETLTFAHVYEESHPHHKWALRAADAIAKRTDGRYKIEVFANSKLGSETEINEGLSLGTVDIIYTGNAFAGNAYGPIALGSAPFVYRDFDHWIAFSKSDLFQDLADGYTGATGHVPLALVYYGARHVTANRPILTPEDMKGMRIRVPDAPLLLMFPRAVGANPTPIAFSEVYLALQQGVVEGQENPLPTIRAKRFYEVQSDINLTGHIFDSQLVIVSGDVWKGMSEEDQAIFREVYREATAQGSEEIHQQEAALADWFHEQGVNVHDVDRAPFAEAVSKVINGPDATWTREQYDRLQALH